MGRIQQSNRSNRSVASQIICLDVDQSNQISTSRKKSYDFFNQSHAATDRDLSIKSVTGAAKSDKLHTHDPLKTKKIYKALSQKKAPAKKNPRQSRIQRCSIPKVTFLDKATHEPIPLPEFNYDQYEQRNKTLEVLEDVQIVEKLNQFFLNNNFRYSSLLGRQNNPFFNQDKMDEQNVAPREGQFPQILSITTENQRQNFKRDSQFIHIVQTDKKIKLVNDSMAFKINPRNSRYFVFGLFTLTRNLYPSLCGLTFATDNAIQKMKDRIYYEILKNLLVSNNKEMAELKDQNALKKKGRGRKNQPELVHQYNFEFPQIVFSHQSPEMIQAVQKIKMQYSIQFTLVPNFQTRFDKIYKKFERHQFKKQKQLLQLGQKVIKNMVQTNNERQIDEAVVHLNKCNYNFYSNYKRLKLQRYCFFNFPKRYYGFNVIQKYESQFKQYLIDLITKKQGLTLKTFLKNVMNKEQEEQLYPNVPYQDKGQILFKFPRLGKLKTLILPRIIEEIVEIHKLSQSVKIQKVTQENQVKYIVGSGKRLRKTTVQFKENKWHCQCGHLQKIGIPCIHLMKVLQQEKKTKYEEYVNQKHFKKHEQVIVQIID